MITIHILLDEESNHFAVLLIDLQMVLIGYVIFFDRDLGAVLGMAFFSLFQTKFFRLLFFHLFHIFLHFRIYWDILGHFRTC